MLIDFVLRLDQAQLVREREMVEMFQESRPGAQGLAEGARQIG